MNNPPQIRANEMFIFEYKNSPILDLSLNKKGMKTCIHKFIVYKA